jgi:hypothetical protein
VVNRVSDLLTDPQVVSNEYLVELDNGLKTVSSPFQLEKTPAPLKKGAPTIQSRHGRNTLGRLRLYDGGDPCSEGRRGSVVGPTCDDSSRVKNLWSHIK